MKRLSIRLTAALITFAVGVLPVTVWHRLTRDPFDAWMEEACAQRREPCASPPAAAPRADERPSAETLPVLSYCELVGDPARYDGKVVRVRATMRMSIHGLFLSDVTCDRYEDNAAVDFQESQRERLTDYFFNADGPVYVGAGAVELIAVGMFRRVVPAWKSDALTDTAPLQFELMKVERAVRPAQTRTVVR